MKDKLKRSLWIWLSLLPIIVVILFPVALMISTSLKTKDQVFAQEISWLSDPIAWENYLKVWSEINFTSSLFNSLYSSILGTILALVCSVPAAYAMAKFTFPGKGIIQQFLLITQMLSPIILIIGLFKVIAFFDLIDHLNALVITYAAYNIAFCIWMLKSYFATIPEELEESSYIEGAGYFKTLFQIFLPQAIPAIAVCAAFSFIFCWNEFVISLTTLRSTENFTLTIQIFNLVGGRYTIDWELVMSAIFLTSLPVVLLFSVLQKYLLKGLTVGAVK